MKKLNLDSLLSKYNPVGDYNSWLEVVEHLTEVRPDREVVDELRQALKRDGAFKAPIQLAEGDLEDEDEDDQPYVANGTHRIVAAILEGALEVDVAHEYQDDGLTMVCVDMTVDRTPENVAVLMEHSSYGGEEDCFHISAGEYFRSFNSPIGWLNTDIISSTNDEVMLSYYAGMEHADEVSAAVLERAKKIGLAINITRVYDAKEWLED